MTAGGLNDAPNTGLTLSAAPGLAPEDAAVASYIERQLERIDLYRSQGHDRTADHIADRLCDVILDPPELSSQGIYATERDAPIITESELRLLDGNR